jgi:hypothetical protein
MKRWSILFLALLILAAGPQLLAQSPESSGELDHGQVGFAVDYFRPSQLGNLNEIGLVGTAGFKVHRNVQLEGQMAWDFNQGFTESCSGCLPFRTARSGVKILHGLFGPKIEGGTHSAKLFGTLKAGFVDFRFSPEPATFGTFSSDIQSLRLNSTNFALYPGGGVELFSGPIGFRAEVGDEMYWQNGTHHNLRIAGGPVLRF